MILTIIGGASGVGKTSLLKAFSTSKKTINTGDLFKTEMSIGYRDEIRKGNWSVFEPGVMSNIISKATEHIQANKDLIVDTHFGAKIFNKEYRIGLKEELLYYFGCSIANSLFENIAIKIVLVTTNPFLLLERRRLDKTRNRELVPSDCYNDLRNNNLYSFRYFSTIKRAKNNSKIKKGVTCTIEYHTVRNEIFEPAQKKIAKILGEEQ